MRVRRRATRSASAAGPRWASPTARTSARSSCRPAAPTWPRAAGAARSSGGDARRRRLVVPVHARAGARALRAGRHGGAARAPRGRRRRRPVSVIDVTTALAALTIAGPLARELFARFTAVDLRPAITPVEGFRPGSVARTPGAILREGEQSWLMLFGAALGSYMWTVVADAAENLGGGPGRGWTRSRRPPSMRDLFRTRRMWRRRAELKDSYDVVIVGGGSHGLAAAYYLAKDHGIGNVAVLEKSYIGSGAAGPQHHDPARQLQDARGRALLRRLAEALRGPRRRARLQPPVLAERPPHARALGPRDVRDGQPRRGQPHQRDRLAADLPGRDQEARARDAGARPARRLSDPGRALPPARRRDPPRRGGLGPGPRRRPRRRRAPPVHRGHRHRAPQRAAWRAVQTNRGTDQDEGGAQLHRRLELARSRTWPACSCRSPRTSSRPA